MDVIILELSNLTFITDYYVICSASNVIQVKTIVENIEKILMQEGIKPLSVEGLAYAHWVLMDYGDIIVHVFEEQTKLYYSLEKFWLDAPRIILDNEDSDSMGRQDKTTLSQRGH